MDPPGLARVRNRRRRELPRRAFAWDDRPSDLAADGCFAVQIRAPRPDDTLLAYGSDASGQFEVYVQPYPGPGSRQQVSVDGGSSPLWSPPTGT
jgi:hypothetical protein